MALAVVIVSIVVSSTLWQVVEGIRELLNIPDQED